MKRFLSLALALMMVLSMVPAMAESTVEYIPAPYTPAEGEKATDHYVTPVVYENGEGEPIITTTLLGVLKVDGKYFKDMDNDKELDVFEDWRNDAQTRTNDLLPKLTNDQKAAFIFNNLMTNPVSRKLTDVTKEDGSIDMTKIVKMAGEGENVAGGGSGFSTASDIYYTEGNLRHAVYRGGTGFDASVVALLNNSVNQMAEFDAIQDGTPLLPFTLISNPISTGYVNYLALAAAVMGDVAEGGDYSMITEYATLDREMWVTQGIRQMYGPQIDLYTDPRWPRNPDTYGEVPEVVAGITKALVEAYQDGSEGVNTNAVALSIKHFPGDGAAENGFESHNYIGQWRIYTTPGSLEKYQLVGFQAACDAGVGSIMPCYSRDTTDARSVAQSYRGVEIPADMVGSAYSYTMMQTLLTQTMGFKGFINTDSGILQSQTFGVEELTLTERYAKLINNGVGAIGAGFDKANVLEALELGLVSQETFDATVGTRIASEFAMGRFDNPYTDPATADATRAANTQGEGTADAVYMSQKKSVVLLKNKDNVLPLNDTTKKVFIASFSGAGEKEEVLEELTALFGEKGFTVVDDEEEADIAYLDIQPTYYVQTMASFDAIGVLDLVEDLELPKRNDWPNSQAIAPDGETTEVTTLEDVDKIAKIAKKVHENGGKVIASVKIGMPWILSTVEPYVDGLIANFNLTGIPAQFDVVTGAYNPTGKLPITLVSCADVIATEFKTLADGNTYEICVSPNDVPGYDKDQYIDPAILAEVPGGSYAYCDSEGNYYRAWFGLSY